MMDLTITITERTYEDCRLEFFCDLRKKITKKMQREAKKAHALSYLSDENRKASEYGQQVSYLDDVIKMLMELEEHEQT